VVPYQVFESSDGHIIIAIGNDTQFERFCELAGVPELARDARFSTNTGRVQHRTALLPELERIVKQRGSEEWAAEFDRHQIPWGPINTIDQVLKMPQVRHRKMRMPMTHPLSDRFEIVGSPLKLSDTPPVYDHPPPLLGEHTEQVLRDLLHYSDDRIQALHQEHAI